MAIDWHDEDFLRRVEQGAFAGVIRGIGLVDEEATRLILRTPKSGEIYTRRGVKHQASAPGEAPASDTGTLIDSKDIGFDLATIRAWLIFRTNYALALEVGTPKIEPRPYARQSLINVHDQVVDAIAQEIGRSIA